jgi:hypothetical protein
MPGRRRPTWRGRRRLTRDRLRAMLHAVVLHTRHAGHARHLAHRRIATIGHRYRREARNGDREPEPDEAHNRALPARPAHGPNIHGGLPQARGARRAIPRQLRPTHFGIGAAPKPTAPLHPSLQPAVGQVKLIATAGRTATRCSPASNPSSIALWWGQSARSEAHQCRTSYGHRRSASHYSPRIRLASRSYRHRTATCSPDVAPWRVNELPAHSDTFDAASSRARARVRGPELLHGWSEIRMIPDQRICADGAGWLGWDPPTPGDRMRRVIAGIAP